MKKIRQSGFVLILAIVLIAVIGLEMFVLAGGSNTMLFQANTAYLQAVERNLVASGLAWAKRNIKVESLDKIIELDITNMGIKSATLSIVMGSPANEEREVQVNTSCSRARQTRSSASKFRIRL